MAAAVGLLAALHFLLRPWLGWWGAPDLAVAALLAAALHLRPGGAAALGFALGLLEGAMAVAGIGPLAAAYAAVGYAAARSWSLVFADVRLFLPLYMVLGGFVLIVVEQWVVYGDLVWGFILVRAPVAALLTAVAGAAAGAVGGGLRG